MKNKDYLKPSLEIVLCEDQDILNGASKDVIVDDTQWGGAVWKE